MKNILKILALTLTVAFATTACSTQKQVTDVTDFDDVTYMFVDGSSIDGVLKGLDLGQDLSKLVGVKSVELITCDKRRTIKQIRPMMDARIAASGLQPMMSVNKDGRRLSIYSSENPLDPGKFSRIAVYVSTPDKLNYIVLTGSIDKADVPYTF